VTEVVLDASVIVKWAFPDRVREAHADRALDVLHAVHAGRLSVVEPPHWLAEVATVVTRLAPGRAARLSAESGQHVFDTLYHAVAIGRRGASLVTADERYYRNARRAGSLLLLQDFAVPAG
jgi:predicted nucleic acid-binding protein